MSTRLSKQLLYESLYGEGAIVLDRETVKDFINESSKVQGVYSDEGLYGNGIGVKITKHVSESWEKTATYVTL